MSFLRISEILKEGTQLSQEQTKKETLKEKKRRLPLPAAIVLLTVGTLAFLRCNLVLGGLGEYAALNFCMLAAVWVSVLTEFRLPEVFSYIVPLAAPGLHFILVELLQQHSRDMMQKMLILNFGFYYAAFFLLLFLFYKKSGWAVCTGSLLAMIAAIVNSCGWQYRSLPVLPWDLYSAGVALSVAGNYSYTFSHLFWTVILAFVTLIVLGFRFPIRHYAPKKVHFPLAAVSAGLLTALILFFQTDTVFTKFQGYRYLFTPTVYYERNGTAVGFLSTLHYLNVSKPSGYSVPALESGAEDYRTAAEDEKAAVLAKAEQAEKATDVLPNVIVIMNEAFSDLKPLADFTTTEPVTPFLDSLKENTVRGNLSVSVKGGNTANTEYEFLTGDSMAFLPAGSIPYQQYIKGAVPTLVTQLTSLGYTASAVHPYYANGWFRDTVYPDFGFEKTTFWEDMQPFYTSEVIRNYYSDKSLFKYLIRQYEEKEPGVPQFQFAVTMQNHGSYDQEYANFTPDIYVNETTAYEEKIQRRLAAYLSLIRRTDDAFAMLVDYFSEADEKTVIVMFGDHQPNDSVVYPLLPLGGVSYTTENLDLPNRYITPFFIWANYDIPEKEISEISVNYLSSLLCETAGIPRSAYQRMLSDLYAEYPVLTARTVSEQGEWFGPDRLNALLKDKNKLLNTYQSYQYNHIFDKKHRLDGFFD